MNILIVAATQYEIKPLIDNFGNKEQILPGFIKVNTPDKNIYILIAGVGIAATAYHLTRILCSFKVDMAVNAGICGSFNDDIKMGEVIQVYSDKFGDFGVENDNEFIFAEDAQLFNKDDFPFKEGELYFSYQNDYVYNLRKAKGFTVNRVHGNAQSIQNVKSSYNADVESMEGAAFFYVCLNEKVPCMQIRAVSNKVAVRDKAAWNIPLAIKNLNNYLIDLLNNLLLKQYD